MFCAFPGSVSTNPIGSGEALNKSSGWRKPASKCLNDWIPGFAGMTMKAFCKGFPSAEAMRSMVADGLMVESMRVFSGFTP